MLLTFMLFSSTIVNGLNPVYLISLLSPTSTYTINVTVDLGKVSCPSLEECAYWRCEIYYISGGTPTLVGTYQTYSTNNLTYSWQHLVVPDNTTQICVRWYYVDNGSGCIHSHNDVYCCTKFETFQIDYTIDCNPCSQ